MCGDFLLFKVLAILKMLVEVSFDRFKFYNDPMISYSSCNTLFLVVPKKREGISKGCEKLAKVS